MKRRGLTIAGSMGLVALAAVGLAAIRDPTPLASAAIFSVALLVLFSSLVAVVALRDRARVSSAGFAIFGWGYLALSLGPWSEATAPHLVTTALIDLAYPPTGQSRTFMDERLGNLRLETHSPRAYWTGTSGPHTSPLKFLPHHFLRVAQSILSLLAATSGGWLAYALTDPRRSRSAGRPDGTEPTTPSPADRP